MVLDKTVNRIPVLHADAACIFSLKAQACTAINYPFAILNTFSDCACWWAKCAAAD